MAQTQPPHGLWQVVRKPSRLGRKFLFSFLIASLLPLLLMGAVSVYLVNSIHYIDIATAEKSVAAEKAAEINRTIDEVLGLLELQVTYEAFAPIEQSQQAFLLERLIEKNTAIKESSFICLTAPLCAVGTETERVTRDASALPALRDFGLAPEFVGARGGQTYFGPAQPNAEGELVITIATPVANKRGETVAVLRGELSLAPIQDLVARAKIGETGYLYVADDTGTVIAHPDASRIGATTERLAVVNALITGRERTDAEASASYQNLQGEIVTGTGVFLPGPKWAVMAEWPKAETQAVVEDVIWSIGRITLGALVLILILTIFTTLRLIRPIAQIKEGVGAIGAGNLDYHFHLSTGDELEELGEHLNQMAINLKAVEELRVLKLRTQVLAENLKKERDLSQLKDQFINTVSHQFNTPLTVISWTLAAMKDPKIPPEMIHESLTKIAQSRKDMLAIVNDLLTLSEIGFHYKKSNTTRIDMQQLVETAKGSVREAIQEKDIKITVATATKDTTAVANLFAMTKVVENLIDNAVTYANDGSTIAIEIAGDDKELRFAIRNEGVGIPAEDKTQIFQQFFRARNAIAKKNVGTGLGLFIVKTIVEGHDGAVRFESEEGKGAAFFFTIPR